MAARGLAIFIRIAVGIEELAETFVRTVKEVGLADGNIIEFRLRGKERLHAVLELGILGSRLVEPGLEAAARDGNSGGEHADVAELARIEQGSLEGMAAAHGQAADRRIGRAGQDAVMALDVLHDVAEALRHPGLGRREAGTAAHAGRIHACGPLARRGGGIGIAVRHDHDARLDLSGRDQVVQDLRRTAQIRPGILVAACTVEDIKDRILRLVARLVIASRRINRHAAAQAEGRTVVPNLGDIAVGYFVDAVEVALVALFFRDDQDVGPGRDVAVHVDVRRIEGRRTVHLEDIGIQFRLQRLGGVLPDAVLFDQVDRCRHVHPHPVHVAGDRRNDVAGQLDRAGLRGDEPEGYGTIGIDFRRLGGLTAHQGLLRMGAYTKRRCSQEN